MLFDYLDEILPKTFPSNHKASFAYVKYKAKPNTLARDAKVVYQQYKQPIISKDSSWLHNNLVIIGDKTCGIYLSMLYHKTKDEKILSLFVNYLCSIDEEINAVLNICYNKTSVTSNSTTSSDDDSSSTETNSSSNDSDSYAGDDALDIVMNIYNRVKPQIGEMVTKMELPPPDGVILSKKSKEVKQADIAYIRENMSTFETAMN